MKIVSSASLLALSVLLSSPAGAQFYAPAPRLAPPAQQAPSDACAPAPQGQGSSSEACKRECARNPQYSPLCAKAPAGPAAAPNWGAAATAPLSPAAPSSSPSATAAAPGVAGASGQFVDGSVRPSAGGNANQGAMKEVRRTPAPMGALAPAPAGASSAAPPAIRDGNSNTGALKILPAVQSAPAAPSPMKTRSGSDACANPMDVDGCRKQCAESLASSSLCVPPTNFDYCSVSPASAVCTQFCQQMNGQYSPACPNAPKAPQTASMGAGTAASATAGGAAPAADVCAPAPQGKGRASAECKRECDRNPQYSSYCSSPPTTPAGGPVAGGGTPSPAAGGASVAARGTTMAMAPALAPQSSSTLPGSQPPPRNLGANAVAAIGCGPYLAQGGEPRFDSVDGQPRGVTFTPGKTYTLKGCGFGDRKGSVALNGSSGGLANLVLLVQKWSEDTIAVLVDPKVAGVADQQSIEVVVLRGDGRRLQQSGHAFEAARESIKLASLPPGVLTREGPNLVRPAPKTTSPAPSGATLLVETAPYSPKGQFCPSEPNRDVINLTKPKLGLRNDFVVERIDVRDLTNKDWAKGDHGENGSYEWHRQNALSSELSGQYAVVVPSWMGLYRKRDALREMLGVMTLGASNAVAMAINENQPPGSSLCWSSYEMDVRVRGPRGLSPF